MEEKTGVLEVEVISEGEKGLLVTAEKVNNKASKQKGRPKKQDEMVTLHSQLGVEFVLNKNTLEVFAKIGGYQEQVDKVKMDDLKSQLEKASKLAVSIGKIKTVNAGRQMGDRVFLYGPTGTGKTHSVLNWLQDQKIRYDMVTVSDGFEDIDFLTYVFPSNAGIQYKEKKIVQLLRDAANGEKVGILIDEANRGSKSFMNFLLKAIDPVTDCYEINNFVADEIIKVPKDNIIWFCTANLGGGYSGANDLDEALLDRFNKVSFVGYNEDFEKELFNQFGGYSKDVKDIVTYIRQLFQDNELKRPISSRSLKLWAEEFINSSRTAEDVFASFEKTVMYRLVSVDSYGFPVKETEGLVVSKFMNLGLIKK